MKRNFLMGLALLLFIAGLTLTFSSSNVGLPQLFPFGIVAVLGLITWLTTADKSSSAQEIVDNQFQKRITPQQAREQVQQYAEKEAARRRPRSSLFNR